SRQPKARVDKPPRKPPTRKATTPTELTKRSVIVIGRGRLLADTTVRDLVREAGGSTVRVATRDPARLRDVLAGPGVEINGHVGAEELQVTGLSARDIGLRAAEHGIALFELHTRQVSLEEAFMELTKDAVEYHGAGASAEAVASAGRPV
ncbi:hypothetical protein ACFVZ7_09610, partial [Streptomyces sp. NPDC059575]